MSGAIVEESPQHHQLQELADLGDTAPGWMYSRWCVDQAYRWMLLTKDPRTDDMVRLVLAATHWDHLDRVVGDPVALTEYGTLVAATDSLVQQLCVYSEGGLRDFLDVCAEAGLLARADRVEEWAEAPLGVFRLQGRRGPALTLRDVVQGAATEVLDLGAFREQPSSVVLGRVVPISDPPYRLFDSRPVPLNEETAQEVAAALRGHDRLGWLWAWPGRARQAGSRVASPAGARPCTPPTSRHGSRRKYDRGMTVKIAVSLPDELVAEARRAVAEGRAGSVSAYVAEAMAEMSRRQSLAELLDAWDVELGAPSAEADAWAMAALDLHAGPG